MVIQTFTTIDRTGLIYTSNLAVSWWNCWDTIDHHAIRLTRDKNARRVQQPMTMVFGKSFNHLYALFHSLTGEFVHSTETSYS